MLRAPGKGWRRLALLTLPGAVGSVALSVLSWWIDERTWDRRKAACNASLLIPSSGFPAGWTGLSLGAATLFFAVGLLLAARRRGARPTLAPSGVVLAVLTILMVLPLGFEALTVDTLYQDARPTDSLCTG
jgi:hypothetical protein